MPDQQTERGQPRRPKTPEQEQAHDVLAAEEFPVPAPDPTLADSEAHDVLAAEEFAVPAPDPTLHHPPVILPDDLTGTAEARDVLAAEEFAMPAPPPGGAIARAGASYEPWVRPVLAVVAVWFVARLVARALRR